MKRTLVTLTAMIIVGALAASCASSKKTASTAPSTTSASPTTPDLTGNWSGRAGTPGREAPVMLRLVQTGTALDGDMYMGGRGDLTGPIKGTVEGNTVRFALGSGFARSSALQISPDGNQITGNMVGSPVQLIRAK